MIFQTLIFKSLHNVNARTSPFAKACMTTDSTPIHELSPLNKTLKTILTLYYYTK